MWISAATRQQVLEMVSKLPVYEEILYKYSHKYGKEIMNDFKQYIWLILCEKSDDYILKAWNNKYFLYLYINIVKNSIKSDTSPWATAMAKDGKYDYIGFYQKEIEDTDTKLELEYIEDEHEREHSLNLIKNAKKAILKKNPRLYGVFKIFDMHFNDSLTYREISAKMNEPLGSVHNNIHQAEAMIRHYIRNKKQNIK